MIVKRVVLQKVQTEMVMDWDDDGEYFDSDDANNDNDADDDATRAAWNKHKQARETQTQQVDSPHWTHDDEDNWTHDGKI